MIRLTTVVLLIFNGISALFGGGALVADPSGNSLNMPVESLKQSAFTDFFIPGLILFVVLGLGSIITSIVVIMRSKGYPFLTIFIGFALSIWISVQMLILHEVNWIHVLYGTIGIVLIILGIFLRKIESEGNN